MLQDLRHDLLLGDEGDDDATAAARAYEDVLAEDAQEQFGPRNARIGTPRWQRPRRRRLFVRTDRLARSERLHVRHDPAAPCGRGSEHSLVADEVSARWRYQCGNPAQELARLEYQDLAAIGERALQQIGKSSVSEPRSPLLHQQRTGAVAAEMSKAFA